MLARWMLAGWTLAGILCTSVSALPQGNEANIPELTDPPTRRDSLRDSLRSAEEAFRAGEYATVVQLAYAGGVEQPWNDRWPLLLIESYLTTGQYREAKGAFEGAAERFGDSLRLRLLAIDVYRNCNEPRRADEQLQIMDRMIQQAPWRYTTGTELVALGKYFLLQGEDPKLVLEACFDQSLKVLPKQIDAHLATAEMALDKGDFKVASQALAKALAFDATSPTVHFLLYRAWSGSDRKKGTEHLRTSLEINPRYVPSLLALAEAKIDEESFADAEIVLAEIEAINPRSAMLWTLRAVIAHLEGRYQQEGEHRAKALESWSLNPQVDYTIGRHLGMHYRFAESAEYQRRSLKMDERYVPAQTQLAQDLLRLGEEQEGWALIEKVRAANPYDVTIYNLKQLQKTIERLAVLEAPGFVVRMDKNEAAVYGDEVLALLGQARETLTAKYQVTLEEPIYVEIFPKQKDFAIRTFGMPGGQGFLGVCFGRLITANSPAALSVHSNWKSVLWHEYCHVVTLQKTKNKMPRWLSEGISVYEEGLKNKAWGQPLDPTYRKMLLGEDFFPISDLSSAFLKAKSPLHLQFAYYESSVAVQFFMEQYGIEALLRMLDDLAVGMPINDALRRAPGSLEALDKGFEQYAKGVAKGMGSGTDWSEPESNLDPSSKEIWYQEHPESYAAIERELKSLLERQEWAQALVQAERLRDLWPEDSREDSVYAFMAGIHRELHDVPAEREALRTVVQRTSSAVDALRRLCEIDESSQNWEGLKQWSDLWIEVQPLSSQAQSSRARAADQLNEWETARNAWRACLALDPAEESYFRFRLAYATHQLGLAEEAKKEVLLALEDSPRYSDALRLLLTINDQVLDEAPK